MAGPLLLAAARKPILAAAAEEKAEIEPFKPCGPGAAYVPRVMAAAYYRPPTMAISKTFDPDANYEGYQAQLREAAKALNMKLDIAPAPLSTPDHARQWAAQVEKEKPDGLVVMRLDFTAGPMMEVETILLQMDVPMLFFVPNQRMFGWGTYGLHERHTRPGRLLCATQDFSHVVSRLNHLGARARLREMRFVNVTGNTSDESRLPFWGSLVRRVPLSRWHEQFIQKKVEITAEVKAIADYYLRTAQRVAGPGPEAALKGALCCVAARNILRQEQADAFTMDCGAAASGPTMPHSAAPCLAFARMLDDGVPAICEQDLTCGLCMALSQLLFGRPGFLHNLGWDTSCAAGGCFVATHCTGPTRLHGTSEKPVPFELRFHHGQIDPMPMAIWPKGQKVTCVKATRDKPAMSIVTGAVVDMLDPKRGGSCTQMVRWKPDGSYDVLKHPDVGGHHHLLLFGDWKKELLDFCRLFKITAVGAV
ncbi:MAG: hypothetical protein FJ290_18795 [Planctomycetes bacterium]|nr:hypothetical protein [Planctomycetota bacterium]